MDLAVEITNTYQKCQLDYYMQAFAPCVTSLSGFLSFGTSLITVLISSEYVSVYEGMSLAAYEEDHSNAGKYIAEWFKSLFDVQLEDATIDNETVVLGTLSGGA